ncbi:transglutaminaseTgpA domain-containing protein [Nocardioides daejeonensis]|uniref:transglutaminase family protein n=1 Tax=Nocardioides daejeonensis TaxID=1046556 RepID=UPI000D74501C|nr:DUF3488 and transglutaminase-like domain-containing protein [Nocardioides daejeonensis]
MSRRPLLHSLPLAVVAALTTWVAFWSWGSFFELPGDFLRPLAGGILLVGLVGVAARAAHLPLLLVASCQLLTVFLTANVAWGSSPWPTPRSLTHTVRQVDTSVDALTTWAPPVPASTDAALVVPLLGALVLYLLVDLLAVTLGRAPLAGLPLLAVQTVPISVLDDGVSWIVFTATAACFLGLLCLQEGLRVGSWGRHFGSPRDNDLLRALNGVDPGRHPLAIGSVVVLLAVVLPLLMPSYRVALLPGGSGGAGDNDVRITNPIADLHRDLDRGEDIPLLQVTTTGERPTYLRISALTQFSGVTWTPGNRDLPAANAADGNVPDPPGLSASVRRDERAMAVQVRKQFSSLWLPTPLSVSEVTAGDDWRYDRAIMDFHSADNSITTAGISYDLVESRPLIEREELIRARPAPYSVLTEYTKLPDDLPRIVDDLARDVTQGEASDYDKAVALQEWFRSPENFTYSLEKEEGAVIGNGNAALERFLSPEGRVGYCEQFSAAMALMARSLGIPARVSVGFLRPDRVGPNTYEFSSHDLHAWPELWFDGFGWVLFEPTPQDRATQVPEYTRGGEGPDNPDPSQSASPSTSSSATAQPTTRPTRAPEVPESTGQTAPEQERRGGPWLLGLVPLALVLLVAPLVPGLLRRRRTRRRLAEGTVEAAWLELRDTAIDLGRSWPEGRSPRTTGREAMAWLGAVPPAPGEQRPATGPLENPDAARALDQLVGRLEQARYAADAGDDDSAELTAQVRTVAAALAAGATPRVRRRARWLPASLFTR